MEVFSAERSGLASEMEIQSTKMVGFDARLQQETCP